MSTNFGIPRAAQGFCLFSCLAAFTLAGCERKERVLDVQTPGADIEVDRNIDTGEVEVEVEDD